MSMPIHDWTRVPSGLFHDFHQSWSIRIKDALNAGLLPEGLAAFVEQRSGPVESDVLTVDQGARWLPVENGAVATLEPPKTRIVQRSSSEAYARRANRIIVTHHLGRTVAVIEIVSPGNKDSRSAIREFVEKTLEFLYRGIHVLIVDLFPPTARDLEGIHGLIWDEIGEEKFELPEGKDRTLVSYQAGDEKVAYVEPINVHEDLPEMRLFVARDFHVPVPLNSTYESTWAATPEILRTVVETGELPRLNAE